MNTPTKQKRQKPYFRISIKGNYPDGSNHKLSVTLYTKKEWLVGLLIQLFAEKEKP